ncbi:MAG: divalent-cation tolerance protein CutA [Proteobacteria bacterium]|nr:divalent-cation tolerance protein CutA [Pseudomonadota bacterium]
MEGACHMVLCTCPDQDTALNIANALVDNKLAACVNIVPGLHSVYRWKGARENAEEVLLIIKSRADDYAPLETTVRALHPYELPEIIAVPINTGLPAYLAWVGRRGEDE